MIDHEGRRIHWDPEWLPLAETLTDGSTELQRAKFAHRTIPFHVSYLDDICGGIIPTDLVVLGAATGAGKTTLGINIACDTAKAGKSVRYFALEAYRGEMAQRLMYREMAKMAWDRSLEGRGEISYAYWMQGKCPWLNVYEREAKENLAKDAGKLSIFHRDGHFTSHHLAHAIRECAYTTDLVVVDHLHFIDSIDDNENRGMKAIVQSISDVVNEVEVPVIAIAHLRKKQRFQPSPVPDIDDFHGSSDIVKIATKCVVLAPVRNVEGQEPGKCETYMRVAKDRLSGDSGITARVVFDLDTNRYLPRYALGRIAGQEWKPISKRPWWARNATW